MSVLPEWFTRDPHPAPGEPVLEVAALWGDWLLDVRHLPRDATVGIGGEGLPGPREDLLVEDGEIEVPRGCTGEMWTEGWSPLERAELREGVRYVVRDGSFCWLVRLVPPGTRLPGVRSRERETGLLASVAFHGFLAAMLWIVVATAPPRPEVSVEEIRHQFAEVLLRSPEPAKKRAVQTPPSSRPERKQEGARAKGKEGKRGQVTGRARRAMERRRSDREAADGAGFMTLLNQGDFFGGMFESTSLGSDLTSSLGSADGPKGNQFGTGLGWEGDGPGGGGNVETLAGGTGTRGWGGDGSSLDGGEPTGPKEEGTIQPGDDVITVGPIDSALIDEVVRRNINRFRYCYQRQLQRDPALQGKVTLKWVIAADGTVSTAAVKRDTMGNTAVTNCMLDVTRRLVFPQPKKGIVIVSYPFLFAPG